MAEEPTNPTTRLNAGHEEQQEQHIVPVGQDSGQIGERQLVPAAVQQETTQSQLVPFGLEEDDGGSATSETQIVLASEREIVLASEREIVLASDRQVVLASDRQVVLASDRQVVLASDRQVVTSQTAVAGIEQTTETQIVPAGGRELISIETEERTREQMEEREVSQGQLVVVGDQRPSDAPKITVPTRHIREEQTLETADIIVPTEIQDMITHIERTTRELEEISQTESLVEGDTNEGAIIPMITDDDTELAQEALVVRHTEEKGIEEVRSSTTSAALVATGMEAEYSYQLTTRFPDRDEGSPFNLPANVEYNMEDLQLAMVPQNPFDPSHEPNGQSLTDYYSGSDKTVVVANESTFSPFEEELHMQVFSHQRRMMETPNTGALVNISNETDVISILQERPLVSVETTDSGPAYTPTPELREALQSRPLVSSQQRRIAVTPNTGALVPISDETALISISQERSLVSVETTDGGALVPVSDETALISISQERSLVSVETTVSGPAYTPTPELQEALQSRPLVSSQQRRIAVTPNTGALVPVSDETALISIPQERSLVSVENTATEVREAPPSRPLISSRQKYMAGTPVTRALVPVSTEKQTISMPKKRSPVPPKRDDIRAKETTYGMTSTLRRTTHPGSWTSRLLRDRSRPARGSLTIAQPKSIVARPTAELALMKEPGEIVAKQQTFGTIEVTNISEKSVQIRRIPETAPVIAPRMMATRGTPTSEPSMIETRGAPAPTPLPVPTPAPAPAPPVTDDQSVAQSQWTGYEDDDVSLDTKDVFKATVPPKQLYHPPPIPSVASPQKMTLDPTVQEEEQSMYSIPSYKSAKSAHSIRILPRPGGRAERPSRAHEVEVSMDGFLHQEHRNVATQVSPGHFDVESPFDDPYDKIRVAPKKISKSLMIMTIFSVLFLIGTVCFFGAYVGPFVVKAPEQLQRMTRQSGLSFAEISSVENDNGAVLLSVSGEDDLGVPQWMKESFLSWQVPYQGASKELPVVWAMAQSGAEVVAETLSKCFGKRQAGIGRILDTSNSHADAWNAGLPLRVVKIDDVDYINVDLFTHGGIARAAELGLAPGRVADLAYTPFLEDSAQLFQASTGTSTSNGADQKFPEVFGRLLVVFRDPVERALNRFERVKLRSGNDGMTLAEFASNAQYAENNPVVRSLLGLGPTASLGESDLNAAKAVVEKHIVVGKYSEIEETIRRYEEYLGWWYVGESIIAEISRCHTDTYVDYESVYEVSGNYGTGDAAGFNTLVASLHMDTLLYRHVEGVFVRQGAKLAEDEEKRQAGLQVERKNQNLAQQEQEGLQNLAEGSAISV